MGLINMLASSNYLVVNKSLARIIGLEGSIILSELISEFEYWEKRGDLVEEEFFFSTIENIEKNTTLSRKKQDKAIKKLKELNLIETKLMGLPSKRYFKLNIIEIQNYMFNELPSVDDKLVPKEQDRLSQMDKQEGSKGTPNNNNINNNNNNIYIEIFNKWNEQNIIKHKELKEVHKKAIDKALKTYTKEEIILAIEHYGKIINSNFYFNYKWSLTDFLNRKNGISTFTDEGTNYINYLNWLDNPPKGYRAVNQGNIKSNYSILYDDDDNYFDN